MKILSSRETVYLGTVGNIRSRKWKGSFFFFFCQAIADNWCSTFLEYWESHLSPLVVWCYIYATDSTEFVVKFRTSKCDFYLKLVTNFAPCFPLPEVAEIWRFDINESDAALRLLIWFFFLLSESPPNSTQVTNES